MIKHNIVRWVVQDVLPEQDPASNYTLRYSLALLMNISLRALGRCVGGCGHLHTDPAVVRICIILNSLYSLSWPFRVPWLLLHALSSLSYPTCS